MKRRTQTISVKIEIVLVAALSFDLAKAVRARMKPTSKVAFTKLGDVIIGFGGVATAVLIAINFSKIPGNNTTTSESIAAAISTSSDLKVGNIFLCSARWR